MSDDSPSSVRLPAALVERFEPLGVIGRGGFGVVVRARQRDLQREVALKVLHPQYLDDPTVRARFEAEAKMVSALSHDAIVPVLDHGVAEDAAYIVFPFIEGKSLREIMDRGPLPWLDAFPHVMRITEALVGIHAAGIVHRDLKPANVLVDGGGNALVTDFGISKPAGQTFHTGHGVVLGTPGYLPPEVLLGEAATARGDLYALGVLAWEMLCARRPYEPEDGADAAAPRVIIEELSNARNGPPHAVPAGVEGLPRELDAYFDRLLAPDPADRFASAKEALASLCNVAEGHSQTRARIKRPRSVSTGSRTAVGASDSRSANTRIASAGARSRSRGSSNTIASRSDRLLARPRAVAGVAAVAFGAAACIALILLQPRPAPRADTSPTAAPVAPAPRERHVETIDALAQDVEREPAILRPFSAGAGVRECPLVVSYLEGVRELTLKADAGCELVALNGKPLPASRDGRVTADPAFLRRGLNWVTAKADAARGRVGLAWMRISGRQAPPADADSAAHTKHQDDLRVLLNNDPRDPVGESKAFIETHMPKGEELMGEVGLALVKLSNEATWNRRFSATNFVNMLPTGDDPYWLEPDTLASARAMLTPLQAALERWPDRHVLWSNLGWVLRKARQPEAARVALVTALRLWPEGHWAWFDLAQLERKLGEPDSESLVARDEGLDRVRRSVDYYDWAIQRFSAAGRGRPPKIWGLFVSYAKRRRDEVPQLVMRLRDRERRSP